MMNQDQGSIDRPFSTVFYDRASRFFQTVAPLSLTACLGLPLCMAGGIWLVHSLAFPAIAQAYTNRVTVSLDYLPGESYTTLVRRAEGAARAIAQRSFDSDILMTEVQVTVVGEREGAVVPLLSMEVSRNEWRSRPDPQRWATYYQSARALLGIGDSPAAGSPAISAPRNSGGTATPSAQPAAIPASPALTPAQQTQTGSSPSTDAVPQRNPVRIDLPAAPGGQLGLPRSILR